PQQVVDPTASADVPHSLIATPRNTEEARDLRDVQPSVSHPLPHLSQRGVGAHGMADPDLAAELGGDLGDTLRFLPAHCYRNLHDDILARLQRLDGLLAVQRTGGGNEDELDQRIREGRLNRCPGMRELPAMSKVASRLFAARNGPSRLNSP